MKMWKIFFPFKMTSFCKLEKKYSSKCKNATANMWNNKNTKCRKNKLSKLFLKCIAGDVMSENALTFFSLKLVFLFFFTHINFFAQRDWFCLIKLRQQCRRQFYDSSLFVFSDEEVEMNLIHSCGFLTLKKSINFAMVAY